MKLIVETLYTSLTQQINCNSEKRVHIGAIIPYLYFHNLSSGEFKLEILKNDSVIYGHFFDWQDIKGSIIDVINLVTLHFFVLPIKLNQAKKYKLQIAHK
jgi:hypothetical protein